MRVSLTWHRSPRAAARPARGGEPRWPARIGRAAAAGSLRAAAAVVAAVALLAAGLQAAGAAPASAAALAPAAGGQGTAPAPVSNAFAMGGGIGGSIDPRTGAFQAQLPLLNVSGPAGGGLSLALSYDQSLAAQGGVGDRFGLGAGWTLGVPWVNTAGGVHVYPASGGSYAYDTSSPTGMAQYPLRDLKFARNPGTIPARPGVAAQAYVYTLTYLDGTVDRFDINGNLVEQEDRFGNPIDLTWQQSGQSWHPLTVTDSYGQVTSFDYSHPNQVNVISPVNAEGITAKITLHISGGRLDTVTDPLLQQTSFSYSPVTGLTAELLSGVVSPTGEQTRISYTPPPYDEPGVVVVNNVTVTNPAGARVLPQLHFDINPRGNTGEHNYTGYPSHVSKTGTDGLFTSGDFGYRYTTELSNDTSAVQSTYNSLHLLVSRTVKIAAPGGTALNQTQTYAYPPVTSVASLPPNYSMPTSVTTVYGNPTFPPTRTVVIKSSYNDRGQLTSATNAAGTTTTTTYDPRYGLPLTQTVTGKDGATSITTNTLTTSSSQCPQDQGTAGKSVKTTTTAVGTTDAQGKVTATARTVATYDYNCSGQVTSESLTWAPGAKPSGDSGGPDQMDTTQQISTDTTAHTQTDVVTAASGTPQAASTTTVTDLVTGQVISQTRPGNLTTTYTYDALGRQLTQTVPGDLTTKTMYDSPTLTTVTAPSGLETQTTTDVTGRTVKVTDNVSGQKLVADPAARTLETDSYAPDGSKLTTTTPAGTTTTSLDPLGRPVSIVQPGGITQAISYNNVADTQTNMASTQTTSVIPAGGKPADATATTVEGFDSLNQPITSATTYADKTPQAPAAETYDGLGRVTSLSSDNLTATPSYAGAGGLQTQATLTPGDTAAFPGPAVTAATGNTMTGAPTAKTLTAKTGTAAGATYTYDAAGRVHTVTAPGGKTTTYTYNAAGQIATVTAPSGTVTSYTYDSGTGRLSEKTIRADGRTQDTGYTYYAATGLVKSVYDPAHPADAISYDYDADGHVIAVHYPDGASTAATYTDSGKLATSTDITGAVTTYTYDTDGSCGPALTDLCSAVQKRGNTTLASVAYTYDSMDRVHTISRGNKITTTLTYTDAGQVRSETTAAADGGLLRRDGYTYDAHGNVATHTVTTALPAPTAPAPTAAGQAAARRRADARQAAATPVTTITAYGYDAYNRLSSSAVYPGATATGTPTSTTTYSVDTAGNVTGQATITGGNTTTTVNTIGPDDQLTTRTVNGKPSDQTFDADGNVTKDVAGNAYAYNLAGQLASVTTPAGVTTGYAYWPDGTRRSATTSVGGVSHTVTFHYDVSGQLVNDTYTDGSGMPGAATGLTVTASYLLTLGRVARTLLAGDGTGGPGAATPPPAGAGTSYYVTDDHGSVTAMIDDQGQVTATYAYGDYGQPVGANPALLPVPAADPAANAAVNPFTYDGAYTNPATGTQYLPARTYDPSQGRFLSLDTSDLINRYQAFNTNPVNFTDPAGQLAVPDIVSDVFNALLFVAFAVVSGGVAAEAAGAVYAAIAAGEEVAASTVASAVLNTVSTVTNIAAASTSATLAADDAVSLNGGVFLGDAREDLSTANFALGGIAGVTSVAGTFADAAAQAATAAGASTATTAEAPTAVTVTQRTTASAADQTAIGPTGEELAKTERPPATAPLDNQGGYGSSDEFASWPDFGAYGSGSQEEGYSSSDELTFGRDFGRYGYGSPDAYSSAQAANSSAQAANLPQPTGTGPSPVVVAKPVAPGSASSSPWAAVDQVSSAASQAPSGPPPAGRTGIGRSLDLTAQASIQGDLYTGWQLVDNPNSLLEGEGEGGLVDIPWG